MENKKRKVVTEKWRQAVLGSPISSPDWSGYKTRYVESESDASLRSVSPATMSFRERRSSMEEIASAKVTPPMSERAKRAHRRASLRDEVDLDADSKPAILSCNSKVSKTTKNASKQDEPLLRRSPRVETRSQTRKRRHVDSNSSEDEPISKSSLLRRRNMLDFPKKKVKFTSEAISKPVREMHAIELEVSPRFRFRTHSVSPTVENNIFARQASLSSVSPSSIPSPNTSNTMRFSTHISPTEACFKPRNRRRDLSRADENINQKGPLANLTRRLSAHVQSLADKNYDTPESDDSELGRTSRREIGDTSTLSAIQATIQSVLEEIFGGIFKKLRNREDAQDESEAVLRENEDRIKNESQRLATLMATQPPTAPPPAQLRSERKDIYRIAEAYYLHGARQAEQMYLNIFRGGQLPTQEELTNLVRDGAGNVVAPRDKWLIIQPQERPDLFYSTISWADIHWLKTLDKSLTESEMFDILKADEGRYRRAYKACDLQRWFGFTNSRPEQSSYPLYNMLQKEHAKQHQQQMSKESNVIYLKAHVAKPSSSVQPIIVEQEQRVRQPSWTMDIDVKSEDGTRAHDRNTWNPNLGIHFASMDRSWKPSHGIHFAPLPEPHIANNSSLNSNLCPHFARGHCKFGKQCKKSHKQLAGSGQNGSMSEKAQKVNGVLNALFAYLDDFDHASFTELQYGDNVDRIARDISSHVAALRQVTTFTPGNDLHQSNFTHTRVQNSVIAFRAAWASLARGMIMPKNLSDAINALDRVISEAKQKMAQVQVLTASDSFSCDNVFQRGGNGKQKNHNVSDNKSGGKNKKVGKSGHSNKHNNHDNNNNNNNNNTKTSKNGKNGSSVKTKGNPFNPSLAALLGGNAILGINSDNNNARKQDKRKNGQGHGKRGGRHGI